MHNLSKHLAADYQVHVLAPHTAKAAKYEVMDGVIVHRFYYLPAFMETLCYEGGIVPRLKKKPIRALQIPFLLIAMLLAALRIAVKEKVDLIHAHWVLPQGVIAWLVSSFLRGSPKVMITSHGADLYAFSHPWLRKLKTFLFNQADQAIVVSHAMQRFCYEELHVEKNVAIAPMGVDCSNKYIEKNTFDKRSGIVFVGRLVEKKGVRYLLEAFSRFHRVFPDETLTIVGDGPDKKALQQRVRQYGLEQSVEFVGAVTPEQVVDYFNSAKVAVMPSITAHDGDQEGLGLVAVEALACGCITLVADIPAVQDAHDEPWLQFVSGDSLSLFDRLCEVFQHPDYARELSRRLKDAACSKFDWPCVAGQYRLLVSSALADD